MSYNYRDHSDNVERMEGFHGYGETYDKAAHEAHDAIVEAINLTASQKRYIENAESHKQTGLNANGVDMYNRVQDTSKLSPEILAILNEHEPEI